MALDMNETDFEFQKSLSQFPMLRIPKYQYMASALIKRMRSKQKSVVKIEKRKDKKSNLEEKKTFRKGSTKPF